MRPKKIKWKWILVFAIVYCGLLVFVKYFNPTMFKVDFNYSSPLTLLYIYNVFQALNHVDVHKISNGIKTLSPLFLPVYTLHPFFIYNTSSIRFSFHAGYPIYWVFISLATITVSWIIMKTKVGKWVFRI
jgi:hypothetical protein